MSELTTVGRRPRTRVGHNAGAPTLEYKGVLGTGMFGKVYAVHSLERGRDEAFKRLFPDEGGADGAIGLRELDALVQMRGHPYITELTEVVTGQPFRDRPMSPIRQSRDEPGGRRDDLIHFAFPRAQSNLLTQIQSGVTRQPETLRRQLCQLLLALEYLHGHGIVHRDLKPENVLIIDEEVVQICDLGMAKRLCRHRSVSPGRFTRFYRPPEHSRQYDDRADMWSLGCIAYEMATGRVLVEAPADDRLVQYTEAALRTWRASMRGQDSALIDLLAGLLEREPSRRWSATRALEAKYFQPLSELISTTRKRYPIITTPVVQVGYRSAQLTDYIVTVVERLQQYWDADNILKPDLLFHALDLFDRSCYSELPFQQRFLASLYVAAKYMITDYVTPFSDLAKACGSEPFDLPGVECALLAEWGGRVCAYTMYELAAPQCTEDQLIDLLNDYLTATTIEPGKAPPTQSARELLQTFLQKGKKA